MIDIIKEVAAFFTAAGVLWGVVYAFVKWLQQQEKQSQDIKLLEKRHKTDMEEFQKKEVADMNEIKDELCVLSYSMLAVFDGLQQLKCNGNVTKARDSLEKHLNQKAHNQK